MNYKIVIDPGHGGDDPGASGNDIIEKEYTLKISKYIKDRLDDLGIPNQIVRTTDETLSPADRVNRIKSYYGSGNNVIVLSNHINAGGGDGAEVIYPLRNNDTLARTIGDELSLEGQNVRKYYQRRLPSDSSKDYYFILRDTADNQAVLIEYGFLDSTGDDVTQLKNNWEQYAEAVVRAVTDYIGSDYVPLADSGYYVVQKGDSLWSISKKFNMTVDELKALNNLKSNLLSIGQVLKIKENEVEEIIETPAGSTVYIVQKGDNLYSIANKYNTTVQDLKDANNLTSNLLSINQQLIIPSYTEEESGSTYVVKSGDTLYEIAKNNNTTVDKLKSYNNISSNLLSIGQILNIPPEESISTESELKYIVQKGDNLYTLSKKYDVTVQEIKDANNLTSNLLSIGQELIIPSTSGYVVYEVQKGDTLYSIAITNGITVDNLKAMNNLTNNTLSIGQKLLIPN